MGSFIFFSVFLARIFTETLCQTLVETITQTVSQTVTETLSRLRALEPGKILTNRLFALFDLLT